MFKYEIHIYWSVDENTFVAEAPELPGCSAQGDSPATALASCEEAIGLWIATAKQLGRTVPEPKGRRLQ